MTDQNEIKSLQKHEMPGLGFDYPYGAKSWLSFGEFQTNHSLIFSHNSHTERRPTETNNTASHWGICSLHRDSVVGFVILKQLACHFSCRPALCHKILKQHHRN